MEDDVTIDASRRRLDWRFPTGGYIDFVGAGRQGATYSERVNTFDWKRFYELGGGRMLDKAREQLRANYDWVLIDSRTGVSDTAGICTMQLPDTVVTCFTMNRQSIDGVDAIMRSIRAFRSPTVDGSDIAFYPMATRIENAEKERLEIARTYARDRLAGFVPSQNASLEHSYWDSMEVSYRPYYAFEEVLSAFGDATGSTRAVDTMLSQMEAMARCVAGDDSLRIPETLERDRHKILARYSLGSTSTTPRKAASTGGILEDGESDADFLRGLLEKEQLWRKYEFDPAFLLSRREIDLLAESDRKSFGRNMTYYLANSERGQRYFSYLGMNFVLNVILTLAVSILVYWISSSQKIFIPSELPFVIAGVAISTWVVSAVLGGLALPSFGPYGVRFMDTFGRLVSGGIFVPIRDFDRSRDPTRP